MNLKVRKWLIREIILQSVIPFPEPVGIIHKIDISFFEFQKMLITFMAFIQTGPAKHRYTIVELNDVLWRNFPKYGEFYFFFYIVYNQIYNHCYYPITMFYGELPYS